MKTKFFLFIFLFCIAFRSVNAQWSVKESELQNNLLLEEIHQTEPQLVHIFPDKEWDQSNFASAEDMEWFKDAKYGMFIHFGLSTLKNTELSWGMIFDRKMPDKAGDGLYTKDVWSKFPDSLFLEKFNRKELSDLIKKSKVKYLVVVAKHHDGFHLWDTKYSDFKSTNTPYGKDFVREVVDVCHEAGIKVGIYYSQRDWYHPDYCPVDPETADWIPNAPHFAAKSGMEAKPGKNHQKYIDYQFNAIRELCTNYGKIDIFWFDAAYWNGMFPAYMWDAENLTRMIRKLQPGIIINNRTGLPGDFDTPEQRIGIFQKNRAWETCMALCDTWSYTPSRVKKSSEIFHGLQSTSVRNGNFLVSWGMKWDGSWDETQKETFIQTGKYLEKYGYSLFNTRGGWWMPEDWGGTTLNKNKIYVHIVHKPDSGKIVLNKRPDFKLSKTKILGNQLIRLTETATTYELDLYDVVSFDEPLIIELTGK